MVCTSSNHCWYLSFYNHYHTQQKQLFHKVQRSFYINLKKTWNNKKWQVLTYAVEVFMAYGWTATYIIPSWWWWWRRRTRRRKKELQLPHQNYTLYSNWDILNHGVQVWISCPLLCPLHINDLSLTITSKPKPTVFADNISIIISHPKIDHFQNCLNIFITVNK